MIYRVLIAVTVLSTLAGCAKFPSTLPTSGKQLVITLKMRGTIDPVNDDAGPGDLPDRYYFVAIDNDNDDSTGPWAVMAPPYGGEGWVTSSRAQDSVGMTSFIRYDRTNRYADPPNCLCLWRVLPGTFFLNAVGPNPPIETSVIDNRRTLRIVIDFSQIATDAIPADQITNLDINLITTNYLSTSGYPDFAREWDGLGQTGRDYVHVKTTNDNYYTDVDEDGYFVADAHLDIESWSIQVQTVGSR